MACLWLFFFPLATSGGSACLLIFAFWAFSCLCLHSEHFQVNCMRNPVGTTCRQHHVAWPCGNKFASSWRVRVAGASMYCLMSCLPECACSFSQAHFFPTYRGTCMLDMHSSAHWQIGCSWDSLGLQECVHSPLSLSIRGGKTGRSRVLEASRCECATVL